MFQGTTNRWKSPTRSTRLPEPTSLAINNLSRSIKGWHYLPVRFADPVERREHDWQDDWSVVADEWHDVLVVPVVEGAFGHLEVGAGHALGKLVEKRHHHLETKMLVGSLRPLTQKSRWWAGFDQISLTGSRQRLIRGRNLPKIDP